MKNRTIELLNIIDNFKKMNILVIGDSILDVFVYSKAIGLSLETPTLKTKYVETKYSFGGASNVAENILALGAKCTFLTLLGDDFNLNIYHDFSHPKFNLVSLIEQNRITTAKERYLVERSSHLYKYLQIDKLDNSNITSKSEETAIDYLKNELQAYDVVLVADYRHGMMSKKLINCVKKLSKKYNKPLFISSQVSENKTNHKDYAGADIICMNKNEAEEVSKIYKQNNYSKLESTLKSGICITMGNKGSLMYLKNNKYFVKPIPVEEIDSCGAGDCFLAALALSGLKKPIDSLYIANCWAGLSVEKLGTGVPKKDNLTNYISENG